MKNLKSNSVLAFASLSFLFANGCGKNPNTNGTAADLQKQADLKRAQLTKDEDARRVLFAQSIQSVGYDFKTTDKSFSFYMNFMADSKPVDIPILTGTLGNW